MTIISAHGRQHGINRRESARQAILFGAEMFSQSDAGAIPLCSDQQTYAYLLDAASWTGDILALRRTLAELKKACVECGFSAPVDTGRWVLQAYASYRVPATPPAPADANIDDVPLAATPASESSPIPESALPQTHSAVLAEVESYWQFMTTHRSALGQTYLETLRSTPHSEVPFLRVVDSYMYCQFQHAPLKDALARFGTIYEELGVRKGIRSYVHALGRCARPLDLDRDPNAQSRLSKLELDEEMKGTIDAIWGEWVTLTSELESKGVRERDLIPHARNVERTWGARICYLAR